MKKIVLTTEKRYVWPFSPSKELRPSLHLGPIVGELIMHMKVSNSKIKMSFKIITNRTFNKVFKECFHLNCNHFIVTYRDRKT